MRSGQHTWWLSLSPNKNQQWLQGFPYLKPRRGELSVKARDQRYQGEQGGQRDQRSYPLQLLLACSSVTSSTTGIPFSQRPVKFNQLHSHNFPVRVVFSFPPRSPSVSV